MMALHLAIVTIVGVLIACYLGTEVGKFMDEHDQRRPK